MALVSNTSLSTSNQSLSTANEDDAAQNAIMKSLDIQSIEPTASASMPVVRRYLLARHGETNYNKERRVQGTCDDSVLTNEGISQAAGLGVYMARRQAGEYLTSLTRNESYHNNDNDHDTSPPITRTWCSPMQRCRQTYAALSGCCSTYGHALPNPTIHENLKEIHLCEWEGRLRREVAVEDEENWKIFKSDGTKLRLGGGFAPVLDCWERGGSNWDAIRRDAINSLKLPTQQQQQHLQDSEHSQSSPPEVIFIMCHGAIGQAMLLQALGLPISMYGKSKQFAFDNCDCIELEWADDEKVARRWRRIHPVGTSWESAEHTAKVAMLVGGGLTSSRY